MVRLVAFGGIDFPAARGSFVAVRRFRNRFVAIFLAGFWLLATQHCGLEAAGVLEAHGEVAQGCCPSGSDEHCSRDGCEVVEGQGVNLPSPIKVLQRQSVTWVCEAFSAVTVPEPKIVPRSRGDESGRPMEWVATWRFVQRAALLPRAPSLIPA